MTLIYQLSPTEEIKIRPPQLKDYIAYTQFINSIAQESNPTHTNVIHHHTYTQKDKYKQIKNKISKIKKHKMIVLHAFNSQNRLIAFVELYRSRHPRTSHMAELGIIIHQQYRGLGLGSIMINQIIHQGKQTIPAIKIIHLTTTITNQSAIKLYTKMGFKQYGLLPNAVKYQDQFLDRILMFKNI